MLKKLALLLLSLIALPAHAVVVDTSANSGAQANQTSYSFSITISALANYIVVIENAAGGTSVPSGVTCGGTAMTAVGNITNGTNSETSIWSLANPGSGSKSIVVTTASTGFQGTGAISLIGVNLSKPLGTLATNFSTSTLTPAVTATGVGINDIYVGGANGQAHTSLAPSGTNQTAQFNINGIGGIVSNEGDTIPGSSAGAFSWTETGANANWTAVAVAVFGNTDFFLN